MARASRLRAWSRSAAAIGRAGANHVGVFGTFGAELAVECPGVVGGGERFGFGAAHRVEDGGAGGAVVGEETRRVVGVGAGVPGVGGLSSAGLAEVAGEPVERRCAEQVHVVPGAALGAVGGARPRVRHVRGVVGPGAGHDLGGKEDLAAAVDEQFEPAVVDVEDGAGGSVEHALFGVAAVVGVDEDAVTGGVDARVGSPARSGRGRAAEFTARGAEGADPIREVFAVGVTDGEDGDVFGTDAVRVANGGFGERLAGVGGSGEFVFPTVCGADGAAGVDVAGAVVRQRCSFGGIVLASVLAERRGRDHAGAGEAFEFDDEAAGGDGLGLVGVAHTPQLRVPGRSNRGDDGGRVAGADL